MQSLKSQLVRYFEFHRIDPGSATSADTVLAYLRINTPLSLRYAEKIMGKKITVCPAAVPPWPPKPVAKKPRDAVVASVKYRPAKNGKELPRKTVEKFSLVKKGMTKNNLMAKGLSKRDVTRWTKSGCITWSS